MKTKALATCILLVLMVAFFGSAASGQNAPEDGGWFTSYRVEDLRTGQLMVEIDQVIDENRSMAPIFGGLELDVTFTVDVPATSPSTILIMSTALLPTTLINSTLENVHWQLVSKNYKLRSFEPNATEVSFQQVKGELTMKLYGKVPLTVMPNETVEYPLITLYNPDEILDHQILDQLNVTVITGQIDEYQSLLVQKEDELQALKDGEVDSGYIEIFENVLNESKVQASLGYVDNAVSMLKALEVEDKPAIGNDLFLPVVGALTIVATVLGILFVRERLRKNNSAPKHEEISSEKPHS